MDEYAIIADGGRQYRVTKGQVLVLDWRQVAAGDKLKLDKVLLVKGEKGLRIGKPTVAGAVVEAEVLGHPDPERAKELGKDPKDATIKGEKIYVQKFRRRKNYRRRTGHRQKYIKVRIAALPA